MHIVSHERRHNNATMALDHKNGISVLSVLFHVGDETNPALRNILDSAETVMNGAGQANPIAEPLSPEQLLPDDRSSYFRYEGSLTTPGCNEFIIWTVMKRSVPLSMTQIERFHKMKTDHGKNLTANYRTPQRLNSRPLVLVKSTLDERSSAAGRTIDVAVLAALSALSVMMHLN